jgi:uncharacterized protein (TIGR02270 family)
VTAEATLSFIPDIVEEHFEELQFLWSQRRTAVRSAAYREREVVMLEERIEARRQGLLVIGDRIFDLGGAALAGDDEMPAFAAAFALLALATPDAQARVIDAFRTAEGKKLDGLRDALAHGPSTPLTPQLTSLFLTGEPPVAAAAGEALAFRGALAPAARDLERLIRAEAPAARAAGWRITAYCAASVPQEWYEAAVADDDKGVNHATLSAAAWNASPVFTRRCRSLAAHATPDAIEPLTMFAAVARPEDYQVVGSVAANVALGPSRFRPVGAYGHPYFVDVLIGEMSNPDPASAVAAGAAFFKMTGRDVESDKRVKVPPDGKAPADDFEAEFMDEVFLPDPELARKHWQELAPRLANSPRICRGMDVSQPLAREQFAALDMESRWEYCLRARLFSGWQGTPLVLERYPQRF